MAIKKIITCDSCGKIKGETNRWWAITTGTGFICKTFDRCISEEIAEADGHLCGELCVTKKFSEWMAKETREVAA